MVDVDAAWSDAVASGDLGGTVVAAAGPQGAATRAGQLAERGGLAGGPGRGDLPGVEPAKDGGEPDHRVAGERFPGRAEHSDLDAQPALPVNPRGAVGELVGGVVEVLGRAQRAAGPDDRQQLRDVSGQRVPDEVRRPVFLIEPL